MPRTFFKRIPKFAFLGEKSPKMATRKQISLARPGDFSPYENSWKTNVDTLSADFPYGEKILRYGE
jgi:hypothetical protein